MQERPVPASDTHAPDAWIDHNEVASRLAHESTVLLQNKPADPSGVAALPAEPSTVSSIAVIGPNADAPRYGDYTGAEHHRGGNINMLNAVPLLEGIKKTYGNHARLESLAVSCPLPAHAAVLPLSHQHVFLQSERRSPMSLVLQRLAGTKPVEAGMGLKPSFGTTLACRWDTSTYLEPLIETAARWVETARAVFLHSTSPTNIYGIFICRICM